MHPYGLGIVGGNARPVNKGARRRNGRRADRGRTGASRFRQHGPGTELASPEWVDYGAAEEKGEDMARKSGSKDFARKHSLNPTGDQRGREEPDQQAQVLRQGEPDGGERKVGQFTGPGTPPLQKK